MSKKKRNYQQSCQDWKHDILNMSTCTSRTCRPKSPRRALRLGVVVTRQMLTAVGRGYSRSAWSKSGNTCWICVVSGVRWLWSSIDWTNWAQDQWHWHKECTFHTYISSQVFASDIRLNANRVPQHSCHGIFPEYHNFLTKKLQPARITGEVDFWNLVAEIGRESRQNGSSGKGTATRDI